MCNPCRLHPKHTGKPDRFKLRASSKPHHPVF
uniref:Uncharacterized protein n=1 Tax=Neisseria meningitidis alpha153 TaxID=663926 RepID=C6SAH4_NEIME|nr:hypothetical protein predicted by Glimmer/Critica [Neisseria meningitidis alpha153]